MKRSLAILLLVAGASTPLGTRCAHAPEPDPHLWLEEVESPEALGWVRKRNEKSLATLTAGRRYAEVESSVRSIVLAKDRVPMPSLAKGWVTNFWQDATHVRGVWRRATVAEYERESPRWETLLDVDALARDEKENWVWKGASGLPPEHDRYLVFLSRGGKDASVVREFDVPTRSFVADGFVLPEAKSRVGWKDADTLLVATDFGPGSLTRSGYPRLLKEWKRGGGRSEVLAGLESDVSVSGSTVFRPEGRWTFLRRSPAFFQTETRLLEADGTRRLLPLPLDASIQGGFQGSLLALLRSPWKGAPAGSLAAVPLPAASEPEVLLAPGPRSSIQDVAVTRSAVYVQLLDDVKGRVVRFRRSGAGWTKEPVDLPDHGSVGFVSSDPFDDRLYLRFESFLVPSTLYVLDGDELRPVKRMPARFSAEGLAVEQREARSQDGTAVPYFVVRRKDAGEDRPTLLYGYGGFEIPLTPSYLGVTGKVWLEAGGAYVLANIRGGGEFGPAWHQAALKERRQNAFDDFIAVAEDLVRRKVTSPRRLGIMGASNGGLLVGATFTQRPDLFGAVVCGVPLLDMTRFHKLLAGHSWVAEYGDPDDPAQGQAIRRWSPYQNVRAGVTYPKVFFVTSTKDDRVHPGHARKMVARMEAQGHDVLYFENIEGGHGAAANLEQRVRRSALEFSFLFRQLAD